MFPTKYHNPLIQCIAVRCKSNSFSPFKGLTPSNFSYTALMIDKSCLPGFIFPVIGFCVVFPSADSKERRKKVSENGSASTGPRTITRGENGEVLGLFGKGAKVLGVVSICFLQPYGKLM